MLGETAGRFGARNAVDSLQNPESSASRDEAILAGPANAKGFNLAEYWRLAVKYRLLIIGALVGTLVAGAAVTLLMTPIYRASTTLQIDREAARVLAVDDVQPRESMVQGEEFFQTQYGLLRSRSLSESVVDSLGLANSDEFLTQMDALPARSDSGTAGERAARRRQAVIKTLQDNLGVSPVRGSRLVAISFQSPDPQLAAKIANAYAENFIQSNLDRKYESSSYARQFLETLIAQTKTRLEDSERQLVAYAADQQIINLREGDSSNGETQSLAAANLSELNAALAVARGERIAAEEKWRQASGASLFTLPEVLNNPTIQRLTEARVTADADYQQKLQLFQPDYPAMVQARSQLDSFTRQIDTIAAGIRNSLRNEYTVALNRERSLQAEVDTLKADVLDLRDRSIQYNILQRELDTSRTLYDGLLQRYKEIGVTGGVSTNNISIVDLATAPQKPSEPRLLINLATSLLLGLGLGVVAAFILEALDETLAAPDDIEAKLGLPLLGMTPLLEKGRTPLDALEDARSNFSEAYYSIRTALQFSTPDGVPTSILITSSQPSEGKSTTAYATALNLARVGKRVLLADGDLRNPSMHRIVGSENDAGMSNLLSGSGNLQSLAKPTKQPNLHFIPCGPLPPNPAELWGGDRLRRILEEASQFYDHVVIDGPPVLGFADAPLLASSVVGTVFVLEARGTRRAQARGALRRLSIGHARLLGAILTKFDSKKIQYGGYDYSYDYNYGPSREGPKTRKAGRS